MLGFGHVDPISLLPDFFIGGFSFNSWLMGRIELRLLWTSLVKQGVE
jgi:hypothetical protein